MRHLEIKREDFLSRVEAVIQKEAVGNARGLLLDMVKYQLSTSGKQLRIHLIYELAVSLKVNVGTVIPWAACCELLHTASIIQDDLQDKDLYRREQETVWNRFGREQAINLNVFFLELSRLVLLKSKTDAEVVLKLLSIASETVIRLVQGQSNEIESSSKPMSHVNLGDYCDWVDSKTASLFLAALDGVLAANEMAILGTDSLRKTIRALGNAFQFADDVLDLFGVKGRKESGCDIKEGKLSFLVLEYQLNYPDDCGILDSVLKKPRELTTANDIAYCKDLFSKKSIPQICVTKIIAYLTQAMDRYKDDLTPDCVKCVSKIRDQIIAPIAHLGSANNFLAPTFTEGRDLSLIIIEKLERRDSPTLELHTNL